VKSGRDPGSCGNTLGEGTSRPLRGLPLPLRWAAVGAISAGVVGGVVGLVVGLRTYAPTALFAVFELGMPASILGGLLGLVSGAIAYLGSRLLAPRR
jgi:hypothetical protein